MRTRATEAIAGALLASQRAATRDAGVKTKGDIERTLAEAGGNIAQAARLARKHRRAFFELLRKHDIDVDRYRAG